MRKRASKGPLSVQAVAGSHVVLLGIDMEKARTDGVLGFAIERIDHNRNNRRDWLAGIKTFKSARVRRGALVPTNEHPVQAFLWSDFTARKGHRYTYRVVAMRGTPGNLAEGEDVRVRVTMADEEGRSHAVYFNRGVAGSQAYVRKFGDRKPKDVPGRLAWRWLSRGLFKALLDFIGQARGSTYGLRAALYEFNQGAVLKAFRTAARSGADVEVIYDGREVPNPDPKKGKHEPAESNDAAVKAAGIGGLCHRRTRNPWAIAHNKFIVLLKDGKPVQVWTGSTNITDGGIFGHSNVGHIVRDPRVAAAYLRYWKKLRTDPEMNRSPAKDEIRPWTDRNFPVPRGAPRKNRTTALFSPRSGVAALDWYAARMNATKAAVFLTAAFGVNDRFEEVFARRRNNLRYLLLESEDDNMETLLSQRYNRIAVGDYLHSNAFERWLRESLTGLNRHVRYIHTKYMLIDPLSDDPIVIAGSANFSDASTNRNDENMLVIRGDTHVADIYLTEFMRLFQHLYFRSVVHRTGRQRAQADAGHLTEDDSWRKPYFRRGSYKYKERLYFSGGAAF